MGQGNPMWRENAGLGSGAAEPPGSIWGEGWGWKRCGAILGLLLASGIFGWIGYLVGGWFGCGITVGFVVLCFLVPPIGRAAMAVLSLVELLSCLGN